MLDPGEDAAPVESTESLVDRPAHFDVDLAAAKDAIVDQTKQAQQATSLARIRTTCLHFAPVIGIAIRERIELGGEGIARVRRPIIAPGQGLVGVCRNIGRLLWWPCSRLHATPLRVLYSSSAVGEGQPM